MPTPVTAANAYAALSRLVDPSAAGMTKSAIGDTAGPDFGSLLKDALAATAEAGRKSDTQAQAVASGKANIVDVVTAVAETEVAIDALVSVRDRVITAYEEIMKMPI